MLDQGQPNAASTDDADGHLMETSLTFVAEKPNLTVIEAVSRSTRPDRVMTDDAAITAENNCTLKRDLGVTVEPDRASHSATSQNQCPNWRATGNRKQRRIVPAMRIQVKSREGDRVLTTVVMDSEVDEAVLSCFVDERHDERCLQLAIATVTGNEVASVDGKYYLSDEKANLTFGLYGTGQDDSAMLVTITGEQVGG